MRFGAALLALLVVGLGVPRLFEPSTLILFQAMRELGPISGWRCAQNPTYVYDPHRERADSTLLADAPEDALGIKVDGLEVERVEANLRGGDTVIWGRVTSVGLITERRAYVLSPGKQTVVGSDLAQGRMAICYGGLGDWRIVGEHALQ